MNIQGRAYRPDLKAFSHFQIKLCVLRTKDAIDQILNVRFNVVNLFKIPTDRTELNVAAIPLSRYCAYNQYINVKSRLALKLERPMSINRGFHAY